MTEPAWHPYWRYSGNEYRGTGRADGSGPEWGAVELKLPSGKVLPVWLDRKIVEALEQAAGKAEPTRGSLGFQLPTTPPNPSQAVRRRHLRKGKP